MKYLYIVWLFGCLDALSLTGSDQEAFRQICLSLKNKPSLLYHTLDCLQFEPDRQNLPMAPPAFSLEANSVWRTATPAATERIQSLDSPIPPPGFISYKVVAPDSETNGTVTTASTASTVTTTTISTTTTTTTTAKPKPECEVLCRTGTGGALCDCDLPPAMHVPEH